MQVGTYADGRTLNYDEVTRGFDIGGLPITPSQVIGYDMAGQVTWQTEDMKRWAYAYAAGMEAGTSGPPVHDPVPTPAPEPVAPQPKQGWFRDLPTVGQVLFFIFYPVSIPYGIWAAWKKGGRFSQLPLWAKVLFVIFYPVSITYGIWAMWRDKRFTQGVRIAFTVVAASFFVLLAATVVRAYSSSGTGMPVVQRIPVAATSETTEAAHPSTESAAVTAPAQPAVTPPPAAPPAATPPPAPAKKVYKAIAAREFAKLCKNPDAYTGRTFIIWGEVTQFDSATGTEGFRANIGATKRPIQYGFADYTQNSIMSGDAAMLSDVVEGDCFGARVTVVGSFSYDTQIGGNTTVPQFQVDAISRYGSTK
jgi:hypothetical protein